MTQDEKPTQDDKPTPATAPLPDGYRAALVTAITVFLGFSLYFLRFWGIENPGTWTGKGVGAASGVIVGIVIQLIALFRSLRVKDNNQASYSATVILFFIGVVTVIAGVIFAIIISA